MSNDLPLALVTGARRGLGRETVAQLARGGHRVILSSRTEDGRAVAQQLADQRLPVSYHQLDVTDGQSITELRQFLTEEHGRLDVLVNNAGIHYDTFQTTVTADFSIVEEAWAVNVLGPWRLAKALYPLLRRSAHPRIVNVSSSSGSFVDSWPGTPAYSMTKAALNMLTLKMADDVREDGILVNAVCPGWVRTEMGGPDAPRSVAEGAAGIVWAAKLPDGGPSGGFFRDGEAIPW